MASLDPVTKALVSDLDRDLRLQIIARRENMLREMRFLLERGDERFEAVRREGWTRGRLEALCGLNSFYQLVLGPLAASARERYGVLGSEVPILYGDSLRFDERRGMAIRAAHATFMSILGDVPRAPRILTAPRFSDLLYRLDRALAEQDRDV